MEKPSRFDLKSIRFRVWGYFILFAIVILGLVWLLQTYFLGAFYEDMKLKETERIAKDIIQEFRSDNDPDEFIELLTDTVEGTDLYIRVETGDGIVLFNPYYNTIHF